MQVQSFRKNKNNFMPNQQIFAAQDLLACHFGSPAAEPAILAGC
jgi:hypothetical protein